MRSPQVAHDLCLMSSSTCAGLVEDGVVAQDDTQASRLWSMRESIAIGLGSAGMVYKYDLSLPLPLMCVLVASSVCATTHHVTGVIAWAGTSLLKSPGSDWLG